MNNSEAGKVTVQKMRREEVEFAVDMAASEGWNPGLHDGEIFYETDPEGFFMARIGEEPVGCASAVLYDDTYGFMGFYVVKNEYRNLGIGSLLTGACLERMKGKIAGLDGVVENEEKYRERMGFTSFYSNLRYEGAGGGNIPEGVIELTRDRFDDNDPVDIGTLARYDEQMFFCNREKFLSKWILQPDSRTFAIIDDGIKGYGTIRKCRSGYKIGPLFADGPELARKLFLSLKSCAGDEPFYFDVPEPNSNAVALAMEMGMEIVFKTIRMYMGGEPKLDISRVYGVTSFELG